MYIWLLECPEQEYEPVRLLKESSQGSVRLIRHRASGQQLILRRFTGNGEVCRKLLGCSCRCLPLIYEAAEQNGENLVLEEFVEGDTLDFLLRGALFTAQETRQIVGQLCQGLRVLHSMYAVHRDIKPANVILRGANAVLIDFDAARTNEADQICLYLPPVTYQGGLVLKERSVSLYGSTGSDGARTAFTGPTLAAYIRGIHAFNDIGFLGGVLGIGIEVPGKAKLHLTGCQVSGWETGVQARENVWVNAGETTFADNGVGLHFNAGGNTMVSMTSMSIISSGITAQPSCWSRSPAIPP